MARPSKTGGKTSEAKARDAKPAKGRKTTKTKRRIAPTPIRVKRHSVSGSSKDLKDARVQQAATAEILKVIASSPTDVQPVFEAIAASANRLLGGFSTAVYRFIDGMVHLAAFTPVNPTADAALRSTFPAPTAVLPAFVLAARGEPAQIADTEALADERLLEISRARGYRSVLFVPLMNGGLPIGMISVARVAPGTFAPHHVQLLQTFADQAVIAIENARLFNETREALERQTATADILKVIASSPSDVQPVFDAIAASGHRLLGGFLTTVFSIVDDMLHLSAFTPTNPSADAALTSSFPRPVSAESWNDKVLNGETVEIPDVETDPMVPENLRELWRKRGFRSLLLVPLVRSGTTTGMINTTRVQPGPFSNHHVQLLQTFADQAVIAIENTRLFNEVQERTRDLTESLEQQTATSEVLEVISASTGELTPVFQKMLENATRVCGAQFGVMNLWDGSKFDMVADYNVPPAFLALRKSMLVTPDATPSFEKIVETHRVIQIHDVRTSPGYLAGAPLAVGIADLAAARTMIVAPMLKEDELLGFIMIYRQEVKPFTDKQVALLENFTKQAVIAIENVRLLNELRQRTDDLTESLHDLRTAQDRLIQTEKLASLGQLTAGIAHEIKNPLNFVNNFSALSAELTDELNDVLKPVVLDDKVRGEIDELTGMLKDNLEKVVQHGKRADSIVKNMLLHSRGDSGEHRPADINSLLDESLNLAYHGARAEKGEFNITLQRDFDTDAGAIELFPQEITRAFLNLIANGVYAATKRKTEVKEPGFEPTLRATTKNLGSTVEIRIRDNGTGIPVEVREKMFNPFFTTKPAGEGTGLGLSMTHDIIVKQHGGRIDVATEPGQFTEFTIVLPRKSNLSGVDRGKT